MPLASWSTAEKVQEWTQALWRPAFKDYLVTRGAESLILPDLWGYLVPASQRCQTHQTVLQQLLRINSLNLAAVRRSF